MLDVLLSFLSHGLANASVGSMLLYLLVMTQLTVFTVTLFYHRSQTHRGVNFHPLLNGFFRLWGWLTTGMVVSEWVAIHRKHHAKVETEEDPHSPLIHGIGKVLWDGVALYRDASQQKGDMEKYGRGTPNDWIERKLFGRHPYWGPALMAAIDFALFGVVGLAVWAVQMIWIPLWGAGVINGLGHWWGYRNFESADKATNLSPWGFWFGGEELHNNHHTFPSSAKFSVRRWEFDIGWAAICVLQKLKLAKVLRVVPALDVRPNVHLPDADTLKAVLTHRHHAMTDYYRNVIVPALGQDAHHGDDSPKSMPRRLRRALANGGRWLDSEGHARMQAMLAKHPTLNTVLESRKRLAAVLEQRGAEQTLKGLQQWIQDAEQSGIRAVQDFAMRLKSYRETAS